MVWTLLEVAVREVKLLGCTPSIDSWQLSMVPVGRLLVTFMKFETVCTDGGITILMLKVLE